MQALLELDCIPVGMELFPATDDDQWTFIKNLIDGCDYYIVIIGGRYGSEHLSGKSYTQMEYEYAASKSIPILSFLPADPDAIPIGKTDRSESKGAKLRQFSDLAQQKMCKYYSSTEYLGAIVSRSISNIIKTKPRTGWVRADTISSEEAKVTILELKEKLVQLQRQIEEFEGSKFSNLSQGDDSIELGYTLVKVKGQPYTKEGIILTWNEIFGKTCTILLDEGSEDEYYNQLSSYIVHKLQSEGKRVYSANVITDEFKRVLIQFKALDLIQKSVKKRSLRDNNTYWKLTDRGDKLLTELRAVKKG